MSNQHYKVVMSANRPALRNIQSASFLMLQKALEDEEGLLIITFLFLVKI